MTNAVKNSLRFNQLKDGPMGISIALSPTQGNLAFSKDAITNASFRARKLPGMLFFFYYTEFIIFDCSTFASPYFPRSMMKNIEK